jgi:predicted cytidylate kinase
MAVRRSVVLNGDLGSGKTTVSVLLAARLGIRRISVGELYRVMAAQRGMTALELNLHAELDDKIDHHVDQLQGDIAASGEQLVVDSRLAWHFFTDALKVHLITEPTVAAQRVLGRPADTVEGYASVEEARSRLAVRSESERIRFLTRYGVDKTRLRNYDLVCDSTSAVPDEIVERIVESLRSPHVHDGPSCHLDPRRIYPTVDVPMSVAIDTAASRPTEPIAVGYAAPYFFAIGGHRHLSAAIRAGRPLIATTLAAEATDQIAGQQVDRYLTAHATPLRVREWEQVHDIVLPRIG